MGVGPSSGVAMAVAMGPPEIVVEVEVEVVVVVVAWAGHMDVDVVDVMSWMLDLLLSLLMAVRRMKYFWAWLATCVGVLETTKFLEMLLQSPFPNLSNPNKNNLIPHMSLHNIHTYHHHHHHHHHLNSSHFLHPHTHTHTHTNPPHLS